MKINTLSGTCCDGGPRERTQGRDYAEGSGSKRSQFHKTDTGEASTAEGVGASPRTRLNELVNLPTRACDDHTQDDRLTLSLNSHHSEGTAAAPSTPTPDTTIASVTGMQLHRTLLWWHQTRPLPPDSTAGASARGGGAEAAAATIAVQFPPLFGTIRSS